LTVSIAFLRKAIHIIKKGYSGRDYPHEHFSMPEIMATINQIILKKSGWEKLDFLSIISINFIICFSLVA